MNIFKEKNSMNQKIVHSLTRCTTTDYEDHLSCIVWFISCNLRCVYCYNDSLVYSKNGNFSLNDILAFLEKRVGLLDAVVLSGGESTVHDLIRFCKKIKEMGFKIKLDTNGLNLNQIKQLVKNNLVDFIALDFKSNKKKFYSITKTYSYNRWLDTLKYLVGVKFDFEVRTTINTKLLNEMDINEMIDVLYKNNYKKKYYIQNFIQTSSNIGNIKYNDYIDIFKLDSSKVSLEFRN